MDLYSKFYDEVLAIGKSFGLEKVSGLSVEPVKDFVYGDIATNLAMILSKKMNQLPFQIANDVIPLIEKITYVKSASFASGFINVLLNDDFCHDVLLMICKTKKHFADCNLGLGEKVNLEFISANPTGPLHIGHIRGAIIFDSLAKILKKVGFNVTKEYYINDYGTQIDVLANSVYFRYKEYLNVANGDQNLEGLYPGEYIKDIAVSLFDIYGDTLLFLDGKESIFKKFSVDYILKMIKNDLKILNIEYDVFMYESKLHQDNFIEKGLSLLKEKNLIYRGFIPMPKDKKKEECKELLLFKSTQFGDEIDRSLQKDDGSWSYFASDVAYHYHKIIRGFSKMIVGLGADHIGYVKRLSAIVFALSDGTKDINVSIYNTVNFLKNGVPLKLSKRNGNIVTIADIMENIDINTLRCAILTRKNDVIFNFDFEKFKLHTNDNPVFYIQYAYARTHSIMKKYLTLINEDFFDFTKIDLTSLNHVDELKMIKCLAKWPGIVKIAAKKYEPHRIIFYLQEIAELLHHLWHNGSSNENLRFIVENKMDVTKARVCLIYAVQLIMEDALDTVGIEALSVM